MYSKYEKLKPYKFIYSANIRKYVYIYMYIYIYIYNVSNMLYMYICYVYREESS